MESEGMKKKLSRSAKRKLARQKQYKKEQIEKFGNDNAKYTAKNLIRQSSRIGFSKKEMKSKNPDHFGIHSKATYKKTMGEVGRFAQFVKEEFGINRLNQFRQEHAEAYLDAKEQQGLTKGSLQNVETALIHLSKAMERDEKFGELPPLMADQRRYTSLSAHQEIERKPRAYQAEEAKEIIQRLEEKGQDTAASAAYLSMVSGLRAEEVCRIERRHFERHEDHYKIRIARDDPSYVTKGNRYREVRIDAEHTSRLDDLLGRLDERERVIPLESLQLAKMVAAVKQEYDIARPIMAMHGFRHLFARTRFQDEINHSSDHLDVMNRILDNLFEGKRADTGFSTAEKELYEETKAAMDRVHDELGHGQNRFDLAMRYLDLKH